MPLGSLSLNHQGVLAKTKCVLPFNERGEAVLMAACGAATAPVGCKSTDRSDFDSVELAHAPSLAWRSIP